MNDYTTQGSFYCPMNVTAVTVGNAPHNQAFHLEVYKTTSDSGHGVVQVAYSYRPDNVHIWWRNGYGGNWSEWYEIANKEDITSLNNNKANTNHTHNDYTATTTVACNYGTVRKFKKNGWAFVVYEDINISPLSLEVWAEIADIGWSNQAGNSYTANFQTSIPDDRFRITADGKLSAMKSGDSNHRGHYGYIVYPTAD